MRVCYSETSTFYKKDMLSGSECAGMHSCRYGSILLKTIYVEMCMLGVSRFC